MTNRTHLTRCATIAIAATLALPSTTLLAQDVAAPPAPAPTIIVPTVQAPPPVAAPAPTIVIPDVSTVEEPVATPRAAPPARTAPRAAAAAPVRAAPRPAPAAEPIPSETTITETAPVEAAPIAAAPAPEPILAPEPAPVAESAGLDDATIFGLGAVGVLGLIAVLFAATRRRRPKTSPEAEAPRIDRPIDRPIAQRDSVAAIPAGTAAPEFAAGIEPQPSVTYAPATFETARVAPSASLSHSGASVALPREVPASFDERDALLKRMIAAKPDRANPFRSTRARAKRARMIIASLGRDFNKAEPWIDLSQYSSNWPEVARRHSAAA